MLLLLHIWLVAISCLCLSEIFVAQQIPYETTLDPLDALLGRLQLNLYTWVLPKGNLQAHSQNSLPWLESSAKIMMLIYLPSFSPSLCIPLP